MNIYETLAGDLTNPQVRERFLLAVLPITGWFAPSKDLVEAMPKEIRWRPVSDVVEQRSGDNVWITFDVDGTEYTVGAWYPIVLGEVDGDE